MAEDQKENQQDSGESTPKGKKLNFSGPMSEEQFKKRFAERPGLSRTEGTAAIDEAIRNAGEEFLGPVPERPESDPNDLAEKRAKAKKTGRKEDVADAIDALEREKEAAESEEVDLEDADFEAPEGEELEGIPFEELSAETGLSPEDVIVTRKVDGEEEQVTLREALDGNMRHAAFTKKTMELSNLREEAEQTREQHARALDAIASVLGNHLTPQQQQQVVQQYQQIQQARELQRQQIIQQVAPQEREALDEALGWEGEEAEEGRRRLREYGRSLGFADPEINSVVDHRIFEVLEKARRYDELQGDMTEATEKAKANRRNSPTLKPGDKNTPRRHTTGLDKATKKARKRLKRTGSARDAEVAVAGILARDLD